MQKIYKFSCTVVILLLCSISFSQKVNDWLIQAYDTNITKFTYAPAEYTKNYNITNAVIAQPNYSIKVVVTEAKGNEIFVENTNMKIFPSTTNDGYQCLNFKLQKDEMIFGGGERALPLNRRGYKFNLYNNPWYAYGVGADNLNYSVPFFISNKGYALFFDNGSKGYADIGKTDSTNFEVGFTAGELNVYIITGNSYQQILSSFHKLVGTQPLPPRWALGNLMSRFGYTSQEQAVDIAAKMKEAKMPIDAIIFDLFWFGDSIKGCLGNLDWINKKKWPNPIGMISNFKKQNINTTLITEPYILENTKAYKASLPYWCKDSTGKPFTLQDFYFGKGGLIDIFKKNAGSWIWNYHYKKQIQNGVTAWWTDLGEPERHPEDLYHNLQDLGVNKQVAANEVHNIYGHYWNKMLYENYAREYPTQRLFHLNRSGFAGSQRYSIFPWSGDVGRNWSGLQAQPMVMLGMSMCGVPYIHADAGGFALGKLDEQLFIRWLQFATYTPIFRPHGTALYDIDKDAPSFPSEAALYEEPYKSYARNAIIERYKILPYTYTLAYRQTKYAEPIVKPLFYNYSTDTNAYKISDEYLFGDNILFAPVLESLQANKKVYLPKGVWYDVENNTLYEGPNTVTLSVYNYKKALFYKEGSFTPQYNCTSENTTQINRQNVNVYYIPSEQPSSYEMYDDDGESKNALATNQYELIKFSSTGLSENGFAITISSTNGKYKNKPLQRNIKLIIPGVNATQPKVAINGVEQKNITLENYILTCNVVLKNAPVKVEVLY